jgi:hypothetical protein
MTQAGSKGRGCISSPYRSWGEQQIARLLERNGIAYKYEHPVAVVDRGKTKIWYADFYLPGYGLIIEYFGVNGDAGYDERTKHKTHVYRDNGIEGLFLTERSFKGDWPTRIISQIEDVLEQRLGKFRSRQDGGRRPKVSLGNVKQDCVVHDIEYRIS